MTAEEVYRHLTPYARRLARRYGLNWEDVLHEGLVTALAKGRLDPRFVYGCMRFRAVDEVRHRERYPPASEHRTEGISDDGAGFVSWSDNLPDPTWEPENVGIRWTAGAKHKLRQYLADKQTALDPTPRQYRRDGAKERARQRVRQRYEQTAQAAD